MRVEQPVGARGSLKWTQRLVARRPNILEAALREAGALRRGATLAWSSPREADAWAEYRDGDALERLGRPDLRAALRTFWPARGPQWDALGRASDGALYLVEAKAHAAELASTCAAVSPASRERIAVALAATRTALGASGVNHASVEATQVHAVAEAFFATLEHELLADADFATRGEAHRALAEFIEVWYNGERRHSSLGYVSPMQYERQLGHRARAAYTPRPVSRGRSSYRSVKTSVSVPTKRARSFGPPPSTTA